MPDDAKRLQHMLEAISEVERIIGARSLSEMSSEKDLQPAIFFYFVVLGEAASALSPELKAKFGDVEWSRISAMRNFLVHMYHRIDIEIVWNTAKQNLPTLRVRIEQILNEITGRRST
jgi:uncharacterized protein with HEPN domain